MVEIVFDVCNCVEFIALADVLIFAGGIFSPDLTNLMVLVKNGQASNNHSIYWLININLYSINKKKYLQNSLKGSATQIVSSKTKVHCARPKTRPTLTSFAFAHNYSLLAGFQTTYLFLHQLVVNLHPSKILLLSLRPRLTGFVFAHDSLLSGFETINLSLHQLEVNLHLSKILLLSLN